MQHTIGAPYPWHVRLCICGSVAASDLGNKKQVIPSPPRNPVALHAKAKERKEGLGIAESFL